MAMLKVTEASISAWIVSSDRVSYFCRAPGSLIAVSLPLVPSWHDNTTFLSR